jgi:hypothetical protein
MDGLKQYVCGKAESKILRGKKDSRKRCKQGAF